MCQLGLVSMCYKNVALHKLLQSYGTCAEPARSDASDQLPIYSKMHHGQARPEAIHSVHRFEHTFPNLYMATAVKYTRSL